MPIQAWLLYRLKFTLTAEILGARSSFGVLAPKLNHISIVLNMATADAIAIALTYDRQVKKHLEERARKG